MAGRLADKVAIITGGAGASAWRPACCSARKARASRWLTAIRRPWTRRSRTSAPAFPARRSAAWLSTSAAKTPAHGGRHDPEGIRRNRRAGQSRRHPLLRAARRSQARDLAAHPRGQSAQLCVVHAEAAIADLRAQRGSIVNISSTHAVNARSGMGQYDVDQGRHRVDDQDARVRGGQARRSRQCGLPGRDAHAVSPRAAAAGARAELDREAEDGCLLGRWADPREVAFPILWLASDEASYVTGAVLMVDGGRYVK